ncbi:apoptosis regulator R1-like isoform X1 [Saccostrea echinata]|uniref:apoptosis regulator R1-like isoform X1 n=1 Tax=Saccostrea echinata TaxID=191078 RepID=UPI002A7FF08C|nr:apoptosis regulator R1-like isoform X1 [Saccostrea echinata]
MYRSHTKKYSVKAMGEEDYKSLVADYVNYRLGKYGFEWENAPSQTNNNKIYKTVRKLGDEFENKQDSSDLHEMVTSLQITPETAYSTFTTVTEEMFSNGINWGRVVALIGFGGALSVECVSRNMPQLVDSIVDWVAAYMNSNLKDWISKNGGWQGFVDFYSKRDRSTNDDTPWVKYGVIGAVGVLALGAFMTQRT